MFHKINKMVFMSVNCWYPPSPPSPLSLSLSLSEMHESMQCNSVPKSACFVLPMCPPSILRLADMATYRTFNLNLPVTRWIITGWKSASVDETLQYNSIGTGEATPYYLA